MASVTLNKARKSFGSVEIIKGTNEYSFDANYKLLIENSAASIEEYERWMQPPIGAIKLVYNGFLPSSMDIRRHDERVYSYVDATSFRVMRDRRLRETLAFDQDFAAAGFVEVYTPFEVDGHATLAFEAGARLSSVRRSRRRREDDGEASGLAPGELSTEQVARLTYGRRRGQGTVVRLAPVHAQERRPEDQQDRNPIPEACCARAVHRPGDQ